MPEAKLATLPKIVLYSKPSCVQCTATKRKFTKEGLIEDVHYVVKDVSVDAEALAEVKGLGYAQAPVVRWGDDHWSGNRPDLIDALLTAEQ